MKAAFVLLGIVLVGVVAWFSLAPKTASDLLIEQATVQPMHGDQFAVVLTINNQGSPDTLLSVSSADRDVSLYNPAAKDALPIQTGRSSLAQDGAHIRLSQGEVALPAGTLVPLTLTFENAGDIPIKARFSDGGTMAHGGMSGMGDMSDRMHADDPTPGISIAAGADGTGWRIKMSVENFTFSQDSMGKAHMPGMGHGHIFVGGMKLGRVFGQDFLVGQLPAGQHEVRVTLNTNDHRPYMMGDDPITATALITVD